MSRAMVACLDLIAFMLASFYHMLRGWKLELFVALGPLLCQVLAFSGNLSGISLFITCWIMPNLSPEVPTVLSVHFG